MWRVNTSSTQARQIHFSSCVTDSTGSADRSSGSIPTAVLRVERGRAFAVFAALRRGFADLGPGGALRGGGFFLVFGAGLARSAGIRTPLSTLHPIAPI